jgi:hypothetical protein
VEEAVAPMQLREESFDGMSTQRKELLPRIVFATIGVVLETAGMVAGTFIKEGSPPVIVAC